MTRKAVLAVLLFSALGLLLAGVVILPQASEPPPSSHPLASLTGARTRVVWCRQVVGNNDDPLALKDGFILMGLDTHDGRGDRALLKQPRNTYRPMLTPDGERVLFTDRKAGKVFVMDWGADAARPVIDGLGLDAWRDPDTGVVWLYYLTNVKHDSTTDGNPVMRCRLDDVGQQELVWDQSPVTSDNFQVSADGKRVGGLFPWRKAGLAELPNGSFQHTGKGCWTSTAPDNSYMMWIFDGAHKNFLIKPPGALFTRKVRLNTAPGTEGHEVYHPRWSNHVRIMAMTGPYRIMAEYNAIHGGGGGINVYVGRFSEAFNRIEAWAQVTDSDEADFFPDVWVDQGQLARASVPVDAAEKPPSQSTHIWPASQEGLVYIWENSKRDNQVNDPTNSLRRECKLAQRKLATFGSGYEAELTGGALRSEDVEAAVAAACGETGAFALELVIYPIQKPRPERGVLLVYGKNMDESNLQLVEKQGELFLRVRTSERAYSDDNDIHLMRIPHNRHTHLVVSYRAGELNWYVNGEPALSSGEVQGDLTPWRAYPLVLGQAPDGTRDWPGSVEGLAVYRRVLGPEEVAAHFQYVQQKLTRRTPPPRSVISGTLIEISPTPTPESIAPYRGSLVEYVYKVDEVMEGSLGEDEIIVQHWGILDSQVLPRTRILGQRYTLIVEPVGDHPELEGERVSSSVSDVTLEPYLDVGWKNAQP